jgi:hypothetical protein
MIKLINARGIERLLPETIILKQIPFGISIPYQRLVGRDGAVVTGKPTREPRQFALEGRIYYPEKERIEQELDALLSLLAHPPVKVYRLYTRARYLTAYPLGAPQDWIDKGAELGISIPMIALDPYWYGPAAEVGVTGTNTVHVDCTAPVIPVISTVDSVSGLTVVNQTTGQQVTVSKAGRIVVDNEHFTVLVDNEPALDAAGEDWVLYGFELAPGDNVITTNAPINIVYRHRWY